MSDKVDQEVLEMYARDDLGAALENGERNPDPQVCDLENWLDRRPTYAEWEVYSKAFDEEKISRLVM